jgi:microcystin-dependent protein
MASTYSDLKIELIGTGEQVGTWGSTTNANLGTAIEEAIVGSADVAFSSSDVTLTLTNTNSTQSARHLRLNLTGTSGGARNLILGSGCQIDKPYIIANGLADTVTVKNTTGTGVAVPAGKSMWVFNNGTNVVEVITHTPVSSGGTGAYTLTANNVILGNGTSAVQFVAPGTSGNVLTSNGTTWTSATPVVFVTGMIMLWSGSIASIPSGWALCDGTSGTPDLRNRFIVGAGSTYAVNATGGSADAIVVSHTHTATTSITDPGHTHSLNISGGATITGIGGSGASGWTGANTGNNYVTTSGTNSSTTGVTASTTVNSAGSSGTNANLPPYYALAYIMKL